MVSSDKPFVLAFSAYGFTPLSEEQNTETFVDPHHESTNEIETEYLTNDNFQHYAAPQPQPAPQRRTGLASIASRFFKRPFNIFNDVRRQINLATPVTTIVS